MKFIQFTVILCVLSILSALPIENVKEVKETIEEENIEIEDRQISPALITPIIQNILSNLGPGLSTLAGPFVGTIAGIIAPALSTAFSGIVTNIINTISGATAKDDDSLSSYASYLMQVPDQGSYVVLLPKSVGDDDQKLIKQEKYLKPHQEFNNNQNYQQNEQINKFPLRKHNGLEKIRQNLQSYIQDAIQSVYNNIYQKNQEQTYPEYPIEPSTPTVQVNKPYYLTDQKPLFVPDQKPFFLSHLNTLKPSVIRNRANFKDLDDYDY